MSKKRYQKVEEIQEEPVVEEVVKVKKPKKEVDSLATLDILSDKDLLEMSKLVISKFKPEEDKLFLRRENKYLKLPDFLFRMNYQSMTIDYEDATIEYLRSLQMKSEIWREEISSMIRKMILSLDRLVNVIKNLQKENKELRVAVALKDKQISGILKLEKEANKDGEIES